MIIRDNSLSGVWLERGMDADVMTRRYMDVLCADGWPVKRMESMPIRAVCPVQRPGQSRVSYAEEVSMFYAELSRKWRWGGDGMSGNMYGFYNLARYGVKGRGVISPEFRRMNADMMGLMDAVCYGQNEWYGDMRDVDGKGKPILYVLGRRQCGKSTMLGWQAETMSSLNAYYKTLITSKNEGNAMKLMRNYIKSPHSMLPLEVRIPTDSGNSLKHICYGKEVRNRAGVPERKGTMSDVDVIAPTVTAAESFAPDLLIWDEMPKTDNGDVFFENALACVVDVFDSDRNAGFFIMAGVAGDFEKHGDFARRLWQKEHEAYNMIRYFIPGWATENLDDCGNEDIEAAVHKIFIRRIRQMKAKGEDGVMDELQRFPLTPDEAMLNSGSGLMPRSIMSYWVGERISHSNRVRQGIFKGPPNDFRYGSQVWHPELNTGMWCVELPKERPRKFDYVAGLDAADYKSMRELKGSTPYGMIFKRQVEMPAAKRKEYMDKLADMLEDEAYRGDEWLDLVLRLGHLPVLGYGMMVGDPNVITDNFYRAMQVYNAMCLAEVKPSTAIERLRKLKAMEAGLLGWTPITDRKARVMKSSFQNYGVAMNMSSGSDGMWAEVRRNKLIEFFTYHSDKVLYKKLLELGMNYDDEVASSKYDMLDALGLCLIMDCDVRLPDVGDRHYNVYEALNRRLMAYGDGQGDDAGNGSDGLVDADREVSYDADMDGGLGMDGDGDGNGERKVYFRNWLSRLS